MLVSMYSSKQLPIDVRSNFELPSWPYNDKHFHRFKAYMFDLSVFRYEDTENDPKDKRTMYSIDFPIESIDCPFKAYYNVVAIDDIELRVIDWPADNPEGRELLKQIDADPVLKDRKAWLYWNIPVIVEAWTGSAIKRKFIHEEIKSNCTDSGCYYGDKTLKR